MEGGGTPRGEPPLSETCSPPTGVQSLSVKAVPRGSGSFLFVFLLAGIHNVNDIGVSAAFANDGSNNKSDRKLNDSMFDAASP